MRFAEIVLPVRRDTFTYGVEGLAVEAGQSVVVAMGKGDREYVGVVWRLHDDQPAYPVKQVLAVGEMVLNSSQMWLWGWLAEYYMCRLGEVMRFAVPTHLKKGSEALRPRREKLEYRDDFELPVLSEAQQEALSRIGAGTTLLHGVTGSGKTEIYTHLIERQLVAGRSVLYLVPEIVMSSQLIGRMRTVFGDRVVVHHSALTPNARAKLYRRLQQSAGGEVIIGVRSAIFLPINNLGAVIVDEEHDPSYKQEDEQPRYNARDCAVAIAHARGVPCLLASATPSIESYANALSGKYAMVSLSERYGGAELPAIEISDTLRSLKRGERHSHFNKELQDEMEKALARGEQVMLLQNRRGVAPYVECPECGEVVRCRHCNVSLTLHRASNTLRCHYCGYHEPLPSLCPACHKAAPVPRGFGTEHLEDELARLFPDARIARLDRDTATSPTRYSDIIKNFNNGGSDILVGTQMIAKGFDFPRVTLVGVVNADNLLLAPDFRATERAFQLLTQMAGRAGRGERRGRVIIQTSQPESPLFGWIAAGDYRSMAMAQLADRQPFSYPPYGRLIEITLRHYNPVRLAAAAENLYETLHPLFGDALSAPHPPLVDRIKRLNLLTLLLKLPSTYSPARAKSQLAPAIAAIRNVEVAVNVDP